MNEQFHFNNRLRQLLLLFFIILLAYLMIVHLWIFLPGLLGGITLYILSNELYFKLVYQKKWKRGGTALLFILTFLLLIALPVFLSIELISPKISQVVNNQDKVILGVKKFADMLHDKTGIELMTSTTAASLSQKISGLIPQLLNSSATIATNLLIMFFLYYYLLVNGKLIEQTLQNFIPLKRANVDKLAVETKIMVRANAIGIPIISIVQGLFAAFGYWIFGVHDWAMWGFVTGVFAFFPIVGTMIIWVPIVIYMFAEAQTWQATALTFYSIIVTGNVDYITRLGLMKKLGNVHPLVTVLGVIVGLGLFGFMGLIFGPLLVSYFIILVKIYMNEFTDSTIESKTNS